MHGDGGGKCSLLGHIRYVTFDLRFEAVNIIVSSWEYVSENSGSCEEAVPDGAPFLSYGI